MKALVVGPPEPAAELAAALAEHGIEADAYDAPHPDSGRAVADLAAALSGLEQRLEQEGHALAVAIDAGDAPTALAVTAAKLGVGLAAWSVAEADSELDRAERRIIATLADCDTGSASAAEAAEQIASWANQGFR